MDADLIINISAGLLTIVAAFVIVKSGNRRAVVSEIKFESALKKQSANGSLAMCDGDQPITNPMSVEALRKNYHDQALNQARTQFLFGLAAASIGFALIIGNGIHAGNRPFLDRMVPGSIISCVATLFLKQSAETRKRATDFYDRLQSYERQREALKLVSDMNDSRARGVAQALLALHMAGAPIKDVVKLFAIKSSGREKDETPSPKSNQAGRVTSRAPKNTGLIESMPKETLIKS